MSLSRSLPEAIRGCWYFVPQDTVIKNGSLRSSQILAMRVDGTFKRYEIKSGRRKLLESGDYSYDGSFLILRGRNSETFRVHRDSFWRWSLEGRRKDHYLIRDLITEENFIDLSDKHRRDIRILPLRAQIEATDSGEEDQIFRITFRPEDSDPTDSPILLGSFFFEDNQPGRRWIGLTPLASGIEPATWERIIHDSFMDVFCSKPQELSVITIRFLDTDQSKVSSYGIER